MSYLTSLPYTWIITLVLGLPVALTSTTSTASDAPRVRLGSIASHGHYNRFIVSYRDSSAENTRRTLVMTHLRAALCRSGLNKSSDNNALPLKFTYRRRLAIGADLVSLSRSLDASAAILLMHQIAADPLVTYVEPDTIIHLAPIIRAPSGMMPSSSAPVASASFIPYPPNDPLFATYQWNLTRSQGGSIIQGGIDVEKAWSVGADGNGIVVAVLDTGITRHPDLDTSLADDGYDFITDHEISGRSADGRIPGGWDTGDWSGVPTKKKGFYPSDWHGTYVAGIIAELTNNGIGLAGVAPKARVLPVRVLGHGGMGWNSDISDGIVWAAGGHVNGVPDNKYPAQVINLSLGGPGRCFPNSSFAKAIGYALRHGVTVVAAVANRNADSRDFTPDSCPGVIAVAANGVHGARAPYSNYGHSVTLSAPGGSGNQHDDGVHGFVWSTTNIGRTGPQRPTRDDLGYIYGGAAGTSFAAPHVSAAVALILGAEKVAGKRLSTPAQIKTILSETARPFPVTPNKPIGAGILDVGAAVDKVLAR